MFSHNIKNNAKKTSDINQIYGNSIAVYSKSGIAQSKLVSFLKRKNDGTVILPSVEKINKNRVIFLWIFRNYWLL